MSQVQCLALGALLLGLCSLGCQGQYVEPCKQEIELHLKSPGSAVWGEFETETTSQWIEVRGRVDSDNAFGASRRTYFVCAFEDQRKLRTEAEREAAARPKVALGDRPFPDYLTRLREGRPIIDWR